MPNLVLTYTCNENCDFCFVETGPERDDYTIQRVRELIPFIRTFGRESINVVGGEPTLHPEFIDILSLLLKQDYIVNVFTNGKMPAKQIDEISNLHASEFFFCVNRSNPILKSYTKYLYQKLGYRIKISVTFNKLKQPLDHILNEIVSYNLDRHYRVGIALPIWPGLQNQYLNPKDYKPAADYLFSFIQKGIRLGVRPTFDCGFPYCFFNESQRKFFQEHDIIFSSNCGVIPDISMDFSVFPCFPLERCLQSISKDACWEQINKKLTQIIQQQKKTFIFDECENCIKLLQKKCSGGCMAFRLEKRAHDLS